MKKIIALFVAVLCVSAGSACMKKNNETKHVHDITVMVMDTTQALLPSAQVKVGAQTFTTSFDGRVVLTPAQLEDVHKLTVSCDGFVTAQVKLTESELLIVRLTPVRVKTPKEKIGSVRYATGTARADVLYSKAVRTAAVAEDVLFYEEAEVAAAYDPEDIVVTGYGMPNNVSAGKLTAGEVNDFTKWYLWPNILDNTHAPFIQEWRIEPRERYTVQVMNKDGYPVVNYPVNLTDQQGNTVFQTLTDNTGKAELWNRKVNGEWLKVNEPQKTIITDDPCGAPEGVDVVFVFDATGSMGDELHYLQAEMKDVIARAKEATDGLAIRTGAVVYRDHWDEYLTRISRLTEDITVTQSFIDKQQASGGGDFPEAVPEALMAALNSAGWDEDARARIAFLILDAPCHNDSATVALLHEQIRNAAAMGVRIVPVVCSGLDKSGEYLMRSIALVTNGTSFFLTDDSGIGHSHLQPTTDTLKVEHLNDMMVRTIVEFSTMPECTEEPLSDNPSSIVDDFIPNPFDDKDLEANPAIPHGEGVHYLLDISGKLLGIYEGELDNLNGFGLPQGIYFIKTYYNGVWHTRKILVR